jgi:hypothetical protein
MVIRGSGDVFNGVSVAPVVFDLSAVPLGASGRLRSCTTYRANLLRWTIAVMDAIDVSCRLDFIGVVCSRPSMRMESGENGIRNTLTWTASRC